MNIIRNMNQTYYKLKRQENFLVGIFLMILGAICIVLSLYTGSGAGFVIASLIFFGMIWIVAELQYVNGEGWERTGQVMKRLDRIEKNN